MADGHVDDVFTDEIVSGDRHGLQHYHDNILTLFIYHYDFQPDMIII